MKCSKQCMYVFNKATRVLGMIKRTIRYKDTRVMTNLYKHSLGLTLNIVLGIHTKEKTKSWSRRFTGDLQKLLTTWKERRRPMRKDYSV